MTPPLPDAPYVFISYSSTERDQALTLADTLEVVGVPVWIDREAIPGGSSWSAEIVRGVRLCTALIVLCSATAYRSANVQRELNLAVEENKPILPLLLEQMPPPDEVRYALAGRQWIEILDQAEAVWFQRVLEALRRLGLGATPAPARVVTPVSPRPNAFSPTAAPTVPGNMPAPLTSFLGRERELEDVEELLGRARLLTLTGPGGTGKTRLALAAAERVATGFPDGPWFVDLSPVSDPALVAPAIAAVFDLRESEGQSLRETLEAFLRRKQLLLLLDNFEQVVDAASLVGDLLAIAPGLRVLVTSRVALHASGEREYAVAPLPLPETATDLQTIERNAAVALFVDRAQAVRSDFRLTAENAAAVVGICNRLDGLPLAIELAAARVKLLPPPQLLARLDSRLKLLTGGARTLPQRQQTLRDAIRWSYDLLTLDEQHLFRRLAVFVGGCTLEAAEAVGDVEGDLDVFEGMASLLDKSLLRQSEGPDGQPRFTMLATIREFALEQLAMEGEEAALRRRHADYFLALAEAMDARYWQAGSWETILAIDAEQDNLRAVLSWAEAEREAEHGLHLVAAMGMWSYLYAPREGIKRAETFVAMAGEAAPARLRGMALWSAAACCTSLGAYGDSRSYGERAASLLREAEDTVGLARALFVLALLGDPSNPEQAVACGQEAIAAWHSADMPYGVALGEFALAAAFAQSGALDAARALLESLSTRDARGNPWLASFVRSTLGVVALMQRDYRLAARAANDAIDGFRAVRDRVSVSICLVLLALARRLSAEPVAGVDSSWREALLALSDRGHPHVIAVCLIGTADILLTRAEAERAVHLIGAADALHHNHHGQPTMEFYFQLLYDRTTTAAHQALGDAAFRVAYESGQALSLDDAVALALRALE